MAGSLLLNGDTETGVMSLFAPGLETLGAVLEGVTLSGEEEEEGSRP